MDGSAGLPDQLAVFRGDCLVIGDAGLGHKQPGLAADMGLVFADLLGTEGIRSTQWRCLARLQILQQHLGFLDALGQLE